MTWRLPRFALGGAVALLAALLLAPAAWSLDKGVTIDPGSPAGQEYALPLAAARQQASGESAGSSSSDGSGPAFGVGISRRHAGSTSTSTDTPGAPPRPANPGSVRHVADAKDPERISDAQLVRATTESQSVPAWTFLLAAAVVAAGLAAGLGLRRLLGR